jgi:aminopeptidase N
LLDDARQDPAFVAECLLPPDENWLGEQLDALDPPRLHAAREALRAALGAALAAPLAHAIARCADGSDGLDARGRGRRRLRNVALGLRVAADPAAAAPDVAGLLAGARLMTDRLAALALHRQHELPGADAALAAFRAEFADDALVLDKWFALEASNPRPSTVERVLALQDDPAFSWRNPNKVRALLGTFARANRVAFHRADGAGYRMLADAVRTLDALNPQVAARLVGALSGWRKIEPARAALMRGSLEQLAALPERSRDLAEIVDRALA